MGFIYVADGIDDVLAVHLDQYADAWTGVSGKGQPFNAVAVNDPINFAISARNLDPTNSRAAQFLKADGTVLFQCDASGVKVSPDGTVASVPVTATSTQTLTNKTLTNPHMTTPVVDSGGLTVAVGGIIASGGITLSTGNLVVTAGSAALTVGPLTIGGTVAAGGSIRLASNVGVNWRNNANTADVGLLFDAADKLNVTTAAGNVGAVAGAAVADLLINVNGTGYRVALKQ